MEAVREMFGMGMEAPIAVSTAGVLGEMFAAGPILNAAIGLNIPDWFALPGDILPNLPQGGGSPMVPSSSCRVLINGLSYEAAARP